VERRGGFWGNAYWYDLQLQRRMPLAERTVSELVLALPPCDGKRVLDVCAGSGRASIALLEAYPTASVVLLDTSSERLSIASKRLASKGLTGQFETVARSVDALDASAPPLLPQPVDVVIGCLAFHVLVERPKHYAQDSVHSNGVTSVIEQYERVFRSIWNSLKPGGHIIFGDHVGQLPLFAQLQALARVGFVDVDCAWRQDDSFVAGARKP
jgi:SAM-dependent methyltransferase